MKNKTIALLSIVAITLLAGCLSETVDYDQLVERNGKHYKVNSEIPFSGHAVSWHAHGQKLSEASFKDGKREGIGTTWDEDGKKIKERTYKDGELIKEEKFDQE